MEDNRKQEKKIKVRTLMKVYHFFWKYRRIDSIIAPFYYILENFSPAVSTLILAGFYQEVYRVLSGEMRSGYGLITYGAAFIVYLIVKQILQLIASISTNAGIYEKTLYILNERLSEKASELPLIAYENAEIMNKKEKAQECVHNDRIPSIFMLSVVLSTSVLGTGALIITLGSWHGFLAVIAIVSVAQFYAAAYFQEKKKYQLSQELTTEKRQQDYLWSLFTDEKSIKEMRVMGFADYLADQWKKSRDKINRKFWREELSAHRNTMYCEFIRIAGYILGIAFSFLLLTAGRIEAGVFGAVLTAFVNVQAVIKNHITSIGRIPVFLEYAKDYFDFIELPGEQEGAVNIGEKIQKISFRKVFFRYPNADGFTLNNIDLEIHEGETVAVVGENGSGKTTLTKVLLGIYAATGGSVAINDIPINSIDQKDLYKKIAYLSQDYMVYKMSLQENVVLADMPENAAEDIKRIVSEIGLDDIAAACGDISQVYFGKEFGGIELSGGQAQRLAIARAIYKAGSLVILDEPTSAIDPVQEAEILSQIMNMVKGRTAIIISHRMSICTRVDKIIVMKEGTVTETGTHEELFCRNGEYTRLFKAQSCWYEA
ncbi:MAG TPA: hypothetical protein DCZ91_25460 [Lachnospiraceae bacterium]|nr:hypothetical protein [Lachnospiraceae bacterium]